MISPAHSENYAAPKHQRTKAEEPRARLVRTENDLLGDASLL